MSSRRRNSSFYQQLHTASLKLGRISTGRQSEQLFHYHGYLNYDVWVKSAWLLPEDQSAADLYRGKKTTFGSSLIFKGSSAQRDDNILNGNWNSLCVSLRSSNCTNPKVPMSIWIKLRLATAVEVGGETDEWTGRRHHRREAGEIMSIQKSLWKLSLPFLQKCLARQHLLPLQGWWVMPNSREWAFVSVRGQMDGSSTLVQRSSRPLLAKCQQFFYDKKNQ